MSKTFEDQSRHEHDTEPTESIELATNDDLDDMVAFLETAYANVYPNDRGITRDMFEGNEAFQQELRTYYAQELTKPATLLFLARHDGKLFGTAGIRSTSDDGLTASLWGFYVATELQGTGIADRLLGTLLQTKLAKNVEKLQLHVAKDAERAQAFYKKHGFVITHDEDWDWPHWTESRPHNQYWVMQLQLR